MNEAKAYGATSSVAWVVHELTSNTRYPVWSDRFRIGGDPSDDLVVPGLPKAAVTLLFHANGEIWLGMDDKSRELAAEEPFDVAGMALVVQAVFDKARVPAHVETHYPYVISAEMRPDCAPSALVEDVCTGARHRLSGGASAVLLYLLSRKRAEDEQAGIEPSECGWAENRDLMVGLWGMGGQDAPLTRLNLLVCGIRQGLREAGFDPWFLEKRRGALRIRALELRVDGSTRVEDVPTEPDIRIQQDPPSDPERFAITVPAYMFTGEDEVCAGEDDPTESTRAT